MSQDCGHDRFVDLADRVDPSTPRRGAGSSLVGGGQAG